MQALKQYNKGKAWCVYKKGTMEYIQVKIIQEQIEKGMNPQIEQKRKADMLELAT